MLRVTNSVVKYIVFTILILSIVNSVQASAEKTAQAQKWAKSIKLGRERTTTLQFYFHDTLTGNAPTAVDVAQPINAKTTYPSQFGLLRMLDDPLTVGPDPKSKLVGRAQGLYGSACQEELSLLMVLTYSFSDGPYKGSSVSIMGRNSVMNPIRELPVVGGTGLFRMARGYAIAHTYTFNRKSGNAIVGYNVTVIH